MPGGGEEEERRGGGAGAYTQSEHKPPLEEKSLARARVREPAAISI